MRRRVFTDRPDIIDIPNNNHSTCHAGSRRFRSVDVPVACSPSSSHVSSIHLLNPPKFSTGNRSIVARTSEISRIPAR